MLQDGRVLHGHSLLRDGTVLIAGANQEGWGALDSTELYDPRTGTFAAKGSRPRPAIGTRPPCSMTARSAMFQGLAVETVTYRFEWSDRPDFQSGRTGFKDNVPEGGAGWPPSLRWATHDSGEGSASRRAFVV